jgi:hypothetical protein
MSASVNTIESYKEIFGQIKLTARMLQTAMFIHLEYLSNIERKEDVPAVDPVDACESPNWRGKGEGGGGGGWK